MADNDLSIAQEYLYYAAKNYSSAFEQHQSIRPEMETQIAFYTKALAGLMAGHTVADAAANAAKS